MNLDTASPLQRRIYDVCLELERQPASDAQTRLVSTLSDASLELARLEASLLAARQEQEELLARLAVHQGDEYWRGFEQAKYNLPGTLSTAEELVKVRRDLTAAQWELETLLRNILAEVPHA